MRSGHHSVSYLGPLRLDAERATEAQCSPACSNASVRRRLQLRRQDLVHIRARIELSRAQVDLASSSRARTHGKRSAVINAAALPVWLTETMRARFWKTTPKKSAPLWTSGHQANDTTASAAG